MHALRAKASCWHVFCKINKSHFWIAVQGPDRALTGSVGEAAAHFGAEEIDDGNGPRQKLAAYVIGLEHLIRQRHAPSVPHFACDL